MLQRITLAIMFFFFSMLLSGCGGPDLPDTFRVIGTITHHGQPVAGYAVLFNPTKGGRPARGETDDEGKFTLSTFDFGDGAISGDHNVAISFITDYKYLPGEEPEGESQVVQKPSVTIPDKYGDPEMSGLKLTVEETGKNNFDIILED